MKKLVVNIFLFPATVLPVVALVAFTYEGLFGDLNSAEPGVNPVFWFIYTAPWVAPAIILAPVIHIAVWGVTNRHSRRAARWTAVVLSPIFLSLAMLTLWGTENFTAAFISPIVVAGLVYGGIFRIYDNDINRPGKT